jgi:hypothetical protein
MLMEFYPLRRSSETACSGSSKRDAALGRVHS